MQSFLPTTPEAWGFVTLLFTTLATAIGAGFKFWSDRRIATANATAAAAKATADALTQAQMRLIEAAERREREANERADQREETANKRMEAALQGMAQLTQVSTELSTINRTMLEELRRANANYEALVRQRQDLRGAG